MKTGSNSEFEKPGPSQPESMLAADRLLDEVDIAVQDVARPSRFVTIFTVVLMVAFAVLIASTFFLTRDLSNVFRISAYFVGAFTAGMTTAAAGWAAIINRRRSRYLQSRQLQFAMGQFLAAVRELEVKAREVSASYLDSDAETATLGDVISGLESLEVWARDDIRVFREVLGLRNQVVHEPGRTVDPVVLADASSAVARLLALVDKESSRALLTPSAPSATEQARSFEQTVGTMLRRVLGESNVEESPHIGFDYFARLPSGVVWIQVKYRSHNRLTLSDVLKIADNGQRNGPGVLIVTNSVLSNAIRAFNATTGEKNNPPIEVITWLDEDDNGLLNRALLRVSRPLFEASEPGNRFEIYQDAMGFHYRLIAANGRILITSEAYDSLIEAMNEISVLRSAATSAQVSDIVET